MNFKLMPMRSSPANSGFAHHSHT